MLPDLKKSVFICSALLATAFCLFFNSCGGKFTKINYKNPQNVCLIFCRSLLEQDIDRAKLVSTEETKMVLNVLQTLSDALPEEMKMQKSELIDEKLKGMKKAKCEVVDDKASCTVCCDENREFETETFFLVKTEDRWLVNMSKEDLKN
jgi:hypothetical protein